MQRVIYNFCLVALIIQHNHFIVNKSKEETPIATL